jgi:uncharacterized protein (DUF58 family)
LSKRLQNLRRASGRRLRAWTARRHGADSLPLTINRRRIYILPTRFGLALAALLAAMLIAALNYNSNLSLAFAFFMVSLALVAMHHCHRNLSGLSVDVNLESDAFAGADAVFYFLLRNESSLERSGLEVSLEALEAEKPARATASVPPHSEERLALAVRLGRRGAHRWDHVAVRTVHPFGWFRAWTYVHASLTAFAAPRPEGNRPLPSAAGSGHAPLGETHGEEEFAGLRPYAPGVALKHMAWKVLARGGEPAVRIYTDLGAQPEWLEWSALEGVETEARLSQLCRWVLACESRSARPYGLRLPGSDITPGRGPTHRARCLRALAQYPRSGAA